MYSNAAKPRQAQAAQASRSLSKSQDGTYCVGWSNIFQYGVGSCNTRASRALLTERSIIGLSGPSWTESSVFFLVKLWFPAHPRPRHVISLICDIGSFNPLLFALVVGVSLNVLDPALEWNIVVWCFVEVGKVIDPLRLCFSPTFQSLTLYGQVI